MKCKHKEHRRGTQEQVSIRVQHGSRLIEGLAEDNAIQIYQHLIFEVNRSKFPELFAGVTRSHVSLSIIDQAS